MSLPPVPFKKVAVSESTCTMATDIGKLRDGKEDQNSAKVECCNEGRMARF